MKRPVIFVALAGIAAMLASVVVYSALKKREAEVQKAMAKTVYIVVAATDLPLGSKVDPGPLTLPIPTQVSNNPRILTLQSLISSRGSGTKFTRKKLT